MLRYLRVHRCRILSTVETCEGPRNITIPESEGECTVVGPLLEIVDVTKPLKLKEVNIGTEENPKLAKIGDYWDDDIVGKIAELLTEYQDLFPMNLSKLKGIVGDLGVSKITLKPDACLFKQ